MNDSSIAVDNDFIDEDLLVFRILAVLFSVMCLVSNIAMGSAALYSRRPRTVSRAKTVLFLSQSFGGLLAPLALIYPSQLITFRLTNPLARGSIEFLTSYSCCYFGSTVPLVLSIMLPLTHVLLLTLDLYLPLIDCQLAWQHWAMLAGVAWFFTLLLALLPLMGWNQWHGMCYLPSSWTSNYAGSVSMLCILEAMACIYMLLGAFIRSRLSKEPLAEEDMTRKEVIPRVPAWQAKARFASLLVLLLANFPVLLHTMVHSDVLSDTTPPWLQLTWLSRNDAVLSWAILIALFAPMLIPPMIIAGDPILSASLVALTRRLRCCRPRYVRTSRNVPRQRNNAVSPASADWNGHITP